MPDKEFEKKAFYRRLRLFGFGVILGCVLVYFLLIRGRNFSFWTPGNRVLEKLRLSEISYTQNAECMLQCLNVSKKEIRILLDSTGTVDFDSSNVHGKCPIYIVRGKNEDLTVTISSCDSTANVLDVRHSSVKDTCRCN